MAKIEHENSYVGKDSKKTFVVPVLFLVFNRLDTTKQVFEAIRQAKPLKLYLASDGPREIKEGEVEIVQAVREYVINNIDWECEVKTLFREQNLGCGKSVSTAISWFFENEEMGIILEDDCLPDDSFFMFCEELLEKYKNDFRIWHISGVNFQDGIKRGVADYYFSHRTHVWGWATWANRWNHYDVKVPTLDEFSSDANYCLYFKQTRYDSNLLNNLKATQNGLIDTWDYQWEYTVFINHGLNIIPNKNLISNIGFGADATHTTGKVEGVSNLDLDQLVFPIKHPNMFVPSFAGDRYTLCRKEPRKHWWHIVGRC